MSTILRLIRRDARHATSNVMAAVVMFGLVIIPSIFTWFNVLASWDPFSNTSGLKVAVASADEGYESDLVPLRINVGDQVLSALRANDQLDWVITSEEDAVAGTQSGEYYAAIVLPKSFSADMLTFYSDGGHASPLTYYTNEKKNALAPKVTGQGAGGVSAEIRETLIKTLSDVALSLVSSLSDRLSDPQTQDALNRLETRVGGIATQLRAGAQTADMFGTLVDGTIPLVNSASGLVAGSSQAFGSAADAVGGGVAAVDNLGDVLSQTTAALSAAFASTGAQYDALQQSVDALFSSIDTASGSQVAVLRDLSTRASVQADRYRAVRDTLVNDVRPNVPPAAQGAIDAVVAQLNQVIQTTQAVSDRLGQSADDLSSRNASAQATHQQVTALIAQARAAMSNASNTFQNDLAPQLNQLAQTVGAIQADTAQLRADLQSASSRLSGASGGAVSALESARAATQKLSSGLTDAASRFESLQAALGKAADTGDLSALREIIGSDPAVLAGAIADPVRIDRVAEYPVVAFGAAMTPLYAMLALWVGALLMSVAIRVDVNEQTLPGEPLPSPTQAYLGRYGIFALTGLAQSTLVMGGLIAFVGISPVHPWLLLLAGWVMSLVFTLIIYTFVVAFGNAGKALAVLLLVIQVSGAGGAYPLVLLPPWFQAVSPFLPATHAISAMRAAIAGIYGADYWASLGMLLLFTLPTLLLGLVLRRPLVGFNRGLVEALHSTKLMN